VIKSRRMRFGWLRIGSSGWLLWTQ
jgi:hypothetical protein